MRKINQRSLKATYGPVFGVSASAWVFAVAQRALPCLPALILSFRSQQASPPTPMLVTVSWLRATLTSPTRATRSWYALCLSRRTCGTIRYVVMHVVVNVTRVSLLYTHQKANLSVVVFRKSKELTLV